MSQYTSEIGGPKVDQTIGSQDNRDRRPGYEFDYERLNGPPTYQIQIGKAGRKLGMIQGLYLNSEQEGHVRQFVRELNERGYGPGDLVEGLFKKLVYPVPGEWSSLDAVNYLLRSAFIDVSQQGTGKNSLFNELLAITIEVTGLLIVDVLSERGKTGDPQSLVRQGFEETRGKTPVGAFENVFDDISREFAVKMKKAYPGLIDEAQGVMLDKLGRKLGNDATELRRQLEKQGLTKDEITARFNDLEFVSSFVNEKLKSVGIAIQVTKVVENSLPAPAVPVPTEAGMDSPSLKEARVTAAQRNAARNGPSVN